jgi:UrcA family protein
MKQGLKIAFAAFVVSAGIIKGAPALAASAGAAVNVSLVHTADLDLSTAAGQRALEVRLGQAAREVCGTASDADLTGKNDVRQCRTDVLAKVYAERDGLLAAAARGAVIGISASR